MQELFQKLQNEHGLNPEQSQGILNTIKNFITEKFPMFGGAIDNLFERDGEGSTVTGDTGTTEGPTLKGGSFLDEMSDHIPGNLGDQAEHIAKDNLGSRFTGNKE
jgi:hypothetical protein